MYKINKRQIFGFVLLAVFCMVPWVINNTYIIKVISNAMLYSIIALSINLIVGFSGQLDFGRSAFAGLGGYFSAVVFTTYHVPFIIAFIGGALFAAFMGALLGLLCRYSSFDYLTLITIGFSEICRKVFEQWYSVTNGSFGFRTSRPSFFGFKFNSQQSMFYFCLVLLILCYIVIRRITKSKMGRGYKAIRDDEIAAAYSGIDIKNYKMVCFIIGSFFTGIAGAAMVHYTMFAAPTNYTIDESLIMLQMPILGGLGSLPGSIIGASVLTLLPEVSRGFYLYRLLFLGILLVILMRFAPNGLLGRHGIKDQIMDYISERRARNNGKPDKTNAEEKVVTAHGRNHEG
ncbi:MAG: branched-chain amino acid ABC transporter permease [Clostridiales bacterium]|nr:branched-chain amino acid ABC transporter permease [Clostridiales bacterium]